MITESSFDYTPIPVITCPNCNKGSTSDADSVQAAGYWGEITCSSCSQQFEIAEAIDEMFTFTELSGFTLWSKGHQIYRPINVTSGQSHLVKIKEIFEEIYIIKPMLNDVSFLAGGLSTKFIRQGYVMISVAPFPNGIIKSFEGHVLIEGRIPDQSEMEAWKKMLLQAKLSMYERPSLTIIMAVNAVDLYLEKLTNCNISSSRPGIWNTLIEKHFGVKLSKLLGVKFNRVEKFVQIRNKIAHGKDYLQYLPIDILEKEMNWLKYRNQTEDPNVPSATFALSTALEIIRICQRLIDKGVYIPVFNET